MGQRAKVQISRISPKNGESKYTIRNVRIRAAQYNPSTGTTTYTYHVSRQVIKNY